MQNGISKPNFQMNSLIKALETENAQLRAALQARTRLETLIETIAGGVATNPQLTPTEQADRTMAIVAALTDKITELETDHKGPVDVKEETASS